MWFATAAKVDREITRLTSLLDDYQKRIEAWVGKLELGERSGFPAPDVLALVRELESSQWQLSGDLRKARLGILMGAHEWKDALPLIEASKVAVKFMGMHLDGLDASAEHGRSQARKLFGK